MRISNGSVERSGCALAVDVITFSVDITQGEFAKLVRPAMHHRFGSLCWIWYEMSLASLKKVKAHRILGVDASTNSIAFCIFEDGQVVSYGEVQFEGASVYERVLDAKRKMSGLKRAGILHADFMAIEAGVVVKSTHIGIKMAYVFGAIMGEILDDDMKVIEVHPISWQSFIKNNNYTKTQKDQVKLDHPGKSENWYKAEIRKQRKQKTLDFAESIGVRTSSDNVSDAVGIAYYAVHKIVGGE